MEKADVMSPRTKPAEVRLDELMDAAQALFISKGFETTTVSEIVRDAGVAKGTFYHYFSSKNDILDALRDRYTQQFIARIQRAIDSCSPLDDIERLRAWCQAGIDGYLDSMPLHDALYHDHHYATRGNKDRDLVLAQIVNMLESGVRNGAWYIENPSLTAIVMYHGMHGAVDSMAAASPQDSPALGEQLFRIFLRLLKR